MRYIKRDVGNYENYKSRIIWGTILFVSVLCVILLNNIIFDILCILLLIGMLYEWHQMTKNNISFMILGIIVIPIAISSIILMRYLPIGQINILIYFILICTTDVFAMLGGKMIGGPKLASIISPNKTWSGLLCGMCASSIVVTSINYFLDTDFLNLSMLQLTILGAIFAFLEQMSDLFVSLIKRTFGIKESGTVIPGHGGILDRCDGIILTAPIALLFIIVLS